MNGSDAEPEIRINAPAALALVIAGCTCPPSVPHTSSQENQMNVWLSSQAVARLTELLAVVAAAPDTSDQHRCQLSSCRSQVGELMPTSGMLVLAGVLREATDRPGCRRRHGQTAGRGAPSLRACWLPAPPRPPPPTSRSPRRAPLATPC